MCTTYLYQLGRVCCITRHPGFPLHFSRHHSLCSYGRILVGRAERSKPRTRTHHESSQPGKALCKVQYISHVRPSNLSIPSSFTLADMYISLVYTIHNKYTGMTTLFIFFHYTR